MTAPAYNTVAWFQVCTDNPGAARGFYGGLFGWEFTESDTGYELISHPGAEAPSGGMVRVPDAGKNSATFLVVVQDVAAACARAEQLGGKILVPPTTAPSGLVFADLLDPSGNHFGIYSPPPSP
ncbi:glyoxalase [Actinomadura rubrobrunea]|mgnify:CR=1 FL=1|uniref:Glyoxalase n=1 Tax=Actinomadura rubrobrunea TaxID=115335 RepID=A0A9W6Q381_9ACTN|nr:VOC family protein [Actinomadura rubrobrunea]GLW67701.1 glyoxalase [Actinomadura rubrobrunea]